MVLQEIIKHALIADISMFNTLQNNQQKFVEQNDELLNYLIVEMQIKKAIVEQDEKEMGLRQLLNFGHTIGHAKRK